MLKVSRLNFGVGRSLRVRFPNAFLAIAAIVLTYLGAEASFSFVGLRYVPLRLHADLPADIRVFAQSSKIGVLPLDPVLLLGDSYAQGYGDCSWRQTPTVTVIFIQPTSFTS